MMQTLLHSEAQRSGLCNQVLKWLAQVPPFLFMFMKIPSTASVTTTWSVYCLGKEALADAQQLQFPKWPLEVGFERK